MNLYVNAAAGRDGDGSKDRPFCRISDAARVAAPGDVVLVAPGIYRENVAPLHAGGKMPASPIKAQSLWVP